MTADVEIWKISEQTRCLATFVLYVNLSYQMSICFGDEYIYIYIFIYAHSYVNAHASYISQTKHI